MSCSIKEISSVFGFDVYDIKAVHMPTLCCYASIICVSWATSLREYSSRLDSLSWQHPSTYIYIIAIFFVSYWLLLHIIRFMGKYVVERLFYGCDLHKMPTIQFLFPSSTEKSCEYRKSLIKKIQKDFGVRLPQKLEGEDDKANFQATARDVLGQIRKVVRSDNSNDMYLRKNIRYGACRNFLGGSLLLLPLEIIYLIFCQCQNVGVGHLAIIAAAAHLVATIICYYSISDLGKEYATELFDNYLNTNINKNE